MLLPNNCSCSEPSVFPKNWKTGNVSLLKKDWRIQYYFKDPSHAYMKDHPRGMLVIVKGMNKYKTLAERRYITQNLLDNEIQNLKVKGYNPIKKVCLPVAEVSINDIEPMTGLINALTMAAKLLKVVPGAQRDIKSIIKGVHAAASHLDLVNFPIGSVTRKHIKVILDRCEIINPRWSPNRFNAYRGYLMMLFKELVELEAITANPMYHISKKSVTKKIKPTLTDRQRKIVDEYLAEKNYRFRQFVHLFFHSGGRKPELLQLQPPMINLQKQKYRCLVKKGKQYREVERTIKTVSLPFWQFFLEGCRDDQYLFGPGFQPGNKAMSIDEPSRCWQDYVKKDLNIQIDFYSLKHLNSTEVTDALDEKAAAELNAHTSTAMVVNIYDVKQRSRQHDRLKNVGNKFV